MDLEEKPLHRKKRRATFIWQNFLVFLSAVLVVGVTVYFVNIMYPREFTPFALPNEEIITVPEEKPELKWWNFAWKGAYRIKMANMTPREVPAGETVMAMINHKSLVDTKKSSPDASDLRVIYQTKENTFEVLKYRLEFPNSIDTRLYFNLPDKLPYRTEVFRYFIYFNNKSVKFNDSLDRSIDNIFNRRVTLTFDNDIFAPFTANFSRYWVLKNNYDKNLPLSYSLLTGTVELSAPFNSLGYLFSWEVVGTRLSSIPTTYPEGLVNIDVDAKSLNPGTYKLHMKFGDYEDIYEFKVSYPLYATWTMDWEGMDVKNEYLDYMNAIATSNEMPITHFFNPRIYVSSVVSPTRRQFLTNWVKDRQEKYGDEISMHLHMHNDFVTAAGVTPRTEVSWGNHGDGYDVLTASYPPEEFEKIVQLGLQQFQANGINVPKGYRAGGWYINLDNLKVLDKLNFAYDSSGRESYAFGRNRVPGYWNLKATTRPYRISETDQNSGTKPTLRLIEFPNNGSESTNVPGTEMLKRLSINFKGDPMTDMHVITFLSHPHWFSTDKPKMEELFVEMNRYTAKRDGGPIVYTTLEKCSEIWNNL